MANNDFGSFDNDGFGDSSFEADNFGDFNFGNENSNSGFGNDNSGFGNDSNGFDSGFDDLSGQGNQDEQGGFDNQQGGNLDFSGQFDDSSNESDNKGGLKKTAIIAVILGIIVLIAVFFIAGIVGKNKANKENENEVTVVENPNINNNPNVNVDNVMQSGNAPESNTTVVNNNNTVVNNNKADDWTEITSDEEIEFYNEYQEHIFTITDIKHYAKLTDNTLIVKTELTGSLSGMSGTYKIEVPYSKGCLLSIGNEFSVKVLKGSFNGRNVVGDIKY